MVGYQDNTIINRALSYKRIGVDIEIFQIWYIIDCKVITDDVENITAYEILSV